MKTMHRTVFSAVTLALALSGPLALAQTKNTSPPDQKGKSTATASTARSDARPVEDLQLAAQRLRDAIHAMAKAPAGPQRNHSIKDANRALAEVQAAMANLPPDLLIAGATETNYQQSVDRLKQAAEKLREAAQALATDPYSKRRNETVKDINKALLETQQVMIDVPISAWGK